MTQEIFFWFFGGLALLLAIAVVALPNPVHGAVALVGNLLSLAALFALLEAHFLAAIQVLLYAGAILVLFVFVIMLLKLKKEDLGQPHQTAAKIAGVIVLGGVGWIFMRALLALPRQPFPQEDAGQGTVEAVGRLLFGGQVLGFEVASVLLLAAIIGAVAVAKRKLR